VDCALYFREAVRRLGVAPLTSMFWYGQSEAGSRPDWRPEIHDSDGLAIANGAGARIWRPLLNPPRVLTNAFADFNPRGFGLIQRDRAFDHYQDDGAFYDRRPSVWVEPIGDWGPGSVQLVEIPTDDETNDNIVAFWTPAAPVRAGDRLDYRYRLSWLDHEVSPVGLARVVATWIGPGGRPGRPRPPHVAKAVVDFEGGALAGIGRVGDVRPMVDVKRGLVENVGVYPVVGTNRWRLMIDVTLQDADSADLQASLFHGAGILTETWSYQIFKR
jgi:glucans biosynthesis protein